MRTAVVIPVGAGREENLMACLLSIKTMTVVPPLVIVVMDGPVRELDWNQVTTTGLNVQIVRAPKHEPGMEQPRNIGVRRVEKLNDAYGDSLFTHVWFLDSDILITPEALEHYEAATGDAYRVLVGPYDWLPGGIREPLPELRNDPRWQSFEDHGPQKILCDDLSAGLACFSGNLVWPIDEFTRIGGFWNELHHGRCEDGELGLRAVACGVPISFVDGARGWHLDHPVNFELTLARNERDVPMLNQRHPWMEGRCCCGFEATGHKLTVVDSHGGCQGLALDGDTGMCTCGAPAVLHVAGGGCTGFAKAIFEVEEDGRRFNVRCTCGWEGNSLEIWAHQAICLPEALR